MDEHPPETHQSYAEEEESEGGSHTAVLPYHVQAGAAMTDGLGEADKMGRRPELHHSLQSVGHTA